MLFHFETAIFFETAIMGKGHEHKDTLPLHFAYEVPLSFKNHKRLVKDHFAKEY